MKIAEHFKMDVGENMKDIVRENLLDTGVLHKLHGVGAGVDTVGLSASSVAGVNSEFTFERRKLKLKGLR